MQLTVTLVCVSTIISKFKITNTGDKQCYVFSENSSTANQPSPHTTFSTYGQVNHLSM